MKCRVNIEGDLPRSMKLTKTELKNAAVSFAEASGKRIKTPFKEVTIILQDDDFSAEVHKAINGVEGPTDVITQRYDAMPGEEEGVYGELYVNVAQAIRVAPKREGWSAKKELLLYVAHGMDHLSGADDLEEKDYNTMRKRELTWLKKLSIFTLSLITSTLSLFAFEEDEVIELDRYFVSPSARIVLPESGNTYAGGGATFGYYLNEFWALEGTAALLENKGYFAADVLWHWYGYERLDPFFTFGASTLASKAVGPKVGAGTYYHLDDNWSLRMDGDAMMNVDGETEMNYSFALGIQYAF